MKTKFVFAMMAAGGLFVAPAFADHHGEHKEAATVEAAAEGAIAAYVVSASGGG